MPLDLDRLRKSLPGNRFARHLHVVDETRSTNDDALAAAQSGAPDGWCLLAERQTTGRGRQGRTWNSSPGLGISASFLIRPKLTAAEGGQITFAAAVAAARAVESLTGLKPSIKWPNDLLLHSRKLAGILTESGTHDGRLLYAIIGIGLNVNEEASDFPDELASSAISLHQALGHPVDRTDIFARLLTELDLILNASWDSVLNSWKKLSTSIGSTVAVRTSREAFRAVLENVENDGALRLKMDDGSIRVCHSAEIL